MRSLCLVICIVSTLTPAAAQQLVRPRFVNVGASDGEAFVQMGIGTPNRFVWLAAGRSVRSGGAQFEGLGVGAGLPRMGPARLSGAAGVLHAGPHYRAMATLSASLPAGPLRLRAGLGAQFRLNDGALTTRASPMSATLRLAGWECGAVLIPGDGRWGARATVPLFSGALTVEVVPARGPDATELRLSYGG